MRFLFHFSIFQQSLLRGVELDWTEEGMYQREERWLINQLNNPLFNHNYNINDENEQERDNETEMNNRNNNYIRLNINDNENDQIRRIYIDLVNVNYEPNYLFLMGFCTGFLANIFGIIFLLCNFNPRFKIGIICGMIISIFFFLILILSANNNLPIYLIN